MASSTAAAPQLPATIPLGGDVHSASEWRTRSMAQLARSVHNETFSEFMAAAEARAGPERSIAPSVRSELSDSQRQLTKRRTKTFFTVFALFQALLISTTVALVFFVQDAAKRSPKAGHIVWLTLSATWLLCLGMFLGVPWRYRRDRKRMAVSMKDAEVKKFKKIAREREREVRLIVVYSRRIQEEIRNESRAAGASSRPPLSMRPEAMGREDKGNALPPAHAFLGQGNGLDSVQSDLNVLENLKKDSDTGSLSAAQRELRHARSMARILPWLNSVSAGDEV
ncbi:hypothetical protein B0A49_08364 [Cryomyces minteri]|uniref:Uncharacterized protein n=1 Tax=Cryomyces minteri TaxID=331657 RepID=A0A4V6WKZ2_9PEZI|nr:hypothetical protein B0A49_08364 [Cryomyces minteri]